MMSRIPLMLAVACLAGPAWTAPAPDADAMLRRVYDNYRAGSSEAVVVMTIRRPEWQRRMEMRTWTRGRDDALVRITAPAKDAGSATLKLGRDTWVFNPRLNQVIRLPASMRSQSWMGSDFSYDDLAKSEDILTLYTHRILAVGRDGDHATSTIEATPKPGAPVVWGKVTLVVRDDDVVAEETFYDQDGKVARRMSADRIGVLGGRAYPLVATMRPLDQPGRSTTVETTSARFDVAAPAWLFTLSNLQNPRP